MQQQCELSHIGTERASGDIAPELDSVRTMYVARSDTAKAHAEMKMPMWNTVNTPRAGRANVDLHTRKMNFFTPYGVGVESRIKKSSGTGRRTCTASPQAPMTMVVHRVESQKRQGFGSEHQPS